MASKYLRRSGVAVGLIAELLGWKATEIWQVGVGLYHEEMEVLKQEWNLASEQIIGFEPNPDTFRRIMDVYPGQLVNTALSDFVGYGNLSFDSRHKDGSTLKGLYHAKTSEQVPITTLDAVGKNVKQGCLLWLDCEGSELDVLKGGKGFLSKVDVVNVEMTGKPPGEGWSRPVEVYQFLKMRGFRLQHVHTQRTTAGQFDAIFVRSGLWKEEYCCCFHELMAEETRRKFNTENKT